MTSLMMQKYRSHLIERPVRTFAVQSGIMQLIGDGITQQVIEKRGKEHDPWRSARMLTYGVCIGGPVVGTWFGFVTRFITLKHWFAAALARTAMDQILFTPVILGCFMGGISVLERRSLAEIQEKFETSYWKGLTNAYRFWPFANLLVFSMVPFMYRPLVNGTFAIGWNSYLSYLNQTSLQQDNIIHPSVTIPTLT
ncbi:integral membrane protein mpv17 pmp22 family [Chlamydoabsidia padenii]|nr:integral membrane protein mpv17 pmp22 family [Chlamydoabsidia padenii]